MMPNIPQAVRSLIAEYRSFLRTSYRFLDPHLRQQFEGHLERAGEGTLFQHQEQAFRIGRAGRSFVITTGTGSGKTEAFLLPVLDGILRRKAEGVRGLQAVFVYPMNALANDQLERLRRLLRGSRLDISFGLYTGDSDTASQALREPPAETERLTRAAIRANPPDILLTQATYARAERSRIPPAGRPPARPACKEAELNSLARAEYPPVRTKAHTLVRAVRPICALMRYVRQWRRGEEARNSRWAERLMSAPARSTRRFTVGSKSLPRWEPLSH